MKVLKGKIISLKMKDTAVVQVSKLRSHPLYKRRIRRDRTLLADLGGFSPVLEDRVKIVEVRPISKNKHFKIMEVLKNGSK